MNKVRTRFAPSPTGMPHVGHLRTCAYAYALSKHFKGDFLLRIEDTDQKRYVPEAVEVVKKMIIDFGMGWDEEVYIQSKRLDLYQKAAKILVTKGCAYEDEGAIRLKVPKSESVSFHDFVLDKDISWNTDVLQDLVLLKSDGFPTYHLAVVVDDHEMGITHVLRGHDWLPSTPIHLLIYKYLEYSIPETGHLTDILDPGGGKLSKRKGSTSIIQLESEGYLREAIFNFTILLGWAPKDNRELFTLDEFVKEFDPKGFQKANPVFNIDKLNWFNGEYIRKTQNSKLKTQIYKFFEGKYPEEKIGKILPLVKERIKTLKEFETLAGFFFEKRIPDKNLFGPKYKEHLEKAIEALEKKQPLDQIPSKYGFKTGDFFMDLRVAVCGSRFTPPISESITILGRKETLARLNLAVANFK